MAVIVKYVVVRDGKEDMIFATKKEADAYDKMLDIAERLYAFLQSAKLEITDVQLDELAFFMAQNRDDMSQLLKGGKLAAAGATSSTSTTDKTEAPSPQRQEAESATKSGEPSKRSRTTKPKAAA